MAPTPHTMPHTMPSLRDKYMPELVARISHADAQKMKRGDLALAVRSFVQEWLTRDGEMIDMLLQRDLATALI
ncbi:MAG: hypothetical protein K2Q32_04310, partial [Alphaproteobacteria bacterium]|nr:hypothetical protein [Alphaproteobacteria bacterium]